MASGDTVFECDGMSVARLLSGHTPEGPGNFTAGPNDGWLASFIGDGGATVVGEIYHKASPAPTVPFDSTKTYDVIIKEH